MMANFGNGPSSAVKDGHGGGQLVESVYVTEYITQNENKMQDRYRAVTHSLLHKP